MNSFAHSQPQGKRAPAEIPEPYAAIIDARMTDDAAYFERHHDANAWVREAVAGEFWPADVPAGTRVRVIHLMPGLRVRQVIE